MYENFTKNDFFLTALSKKKFFFLSFTLTVTNLKEQLELDMEQQTGSK